MRINPSTPSATKSIFYDFIRKKYEIKEKFIPPKENELKKKDECNLQSSRQQPKHTFLTLIFV